MSKYVTIESTRCVKTDDRRNKFYSKRCTIMLRVHDVLGVVRQSNDRHRVIVALRDALRAALPELRVITSRPIQVSPTGAYFANNDCGVSISWGRDADKPSQLLADAALRDLFTVSDERLLAIVKAKRLEVMLAITAEVKEELAVEMAEHAMCDFLAHINAEAKKACRFEQRLAALKAEFASEIRVQAVSQLTLAEQELSEYTGYTKEAGEFFLGHVDAYIKEFAPSGVPSLFGLNKHKQRGAWLLKRVRPETTDND